MFQNKKYSDPRLRFQQSGFRKELQKARNYKRPPIREAKNKLDEALANIGLSSWKSRLIVFMLLATAVYVLYAPNFLTIKNVKVAGADKALEEKIVSIVHDYFRFHKAWPQQNLLLLSKNGLATYIKQNGIAVFSVDKVGKNYFDTVELSVTPRLETFLLESGGKQLVLYQDGVISKDMSFFPSSTLPTRLTAIKTDEIESGEVGKNALPPVTLEAILSLKSMLNQNLPVPITHFRMAKASSLDIEAHTASGAKLIFDRSPNIEKLSKELPLLWSSLNEGQRKNLFYLDMRMPDRGFVCLKNTPCTIDYKTVVSTSTPDITATASSSTSTLPLINSSKP